MTKIEYSGTVETIVDSQPYSFEFEYGNYELVLTVYGELYEKTLDKNGNQSFGETPLKQLPFNGLKGVVKGSCLPIYFTFSDTDFFWLSHKLHLYVKHVFVYNTINDSQQPCSLTFYSNQFHKFLSMGPRNIKDSNGHFSSEQMKSTFTMEGQECSLVPIYDESKNLPGIKLTFDFPSKDKKEKEYVCELYWSMIRFLSYIFRRQDILPDKVLFTLSDGSGEMLSELCKERHYDKETSLPWQDAYEHMGDLFNLIHLDSAKHDSDYQNHIFTTHLPINLKEKNSISTQTALAIVRTFESEFDKHYTSWTPFKQPEAYIEAEKIIQDELDNLIKQNKENKKEERSSKIRKIIKKQYKYFKDNAIYKASLADKIKHALDDCFYCLVNIKKDLNMTDEDIKQMPKKCSDFRNDIAHGRQKNKISEMEEIEPYIALLNCLIYVMQLEEVGYTKEEINNLLPYLCC